MISGFGGSTRSSRPHNRDAGGGDFPIPFNMPKVLHNLLFEDMDLMFDNKQQDLINLLRFSYEALPKMHERYKQKDKELRSKLIENSDNQKVKNKLEQLKLDRLEGANDFREFVIVISDVLTREQYAKLLKFSNINI